MTQFSITLNTPAGTERRSIVADAPFLALISALATLQLPSGPFTLTCAPVKTLEAA